MQLPIKPSSALQALVFCLALIPLARLGIGVALYPEWLGANAGPAGGGSVVAARIGARVAR